MMDKARNNHGELDEPVSNQDMKPPITRDADEYPWSRKDLEHFEWGDSHDQFNSWLTERIIVWAAIILVIVGIWVVF